MVKRRRKSFLLTLIRFVMIEEYRGFEIQENEHSWAKYPQTKFVFFLKDWDIDDPHGNGESVEDCKEQIDEIIQLKIEENK